jgi:phospholipid/cholesterol/gamma-HCH transport system substrate-binding protein
MKRRDEVLVGVLITVALLVGIGGTLWLARKGFGSSYPLHTRFAWGAGLKQGQQLLLAGVQVGSVSAIELNPDGYLDVTLDVSNDYRIPLGSTATMKTISFFGDQAVAINPPLEPSGRVFQANDTIPAGPPGASVDDLLARFDTISRDVKSLTAAFDAQFVGGGGIADMRRAMASANQLVQQLSGVAAEQSRNLTATMASVRRATTAIDSAVIDSTLRNVRASTGNLTALTDSLRATTARMNALLAKVESGEGSAAKLLNDPGLYNDTRALLAQMDSLMADFKRNPRKYINLRVF